MALVANNIERSIMGEENHQVDDSDLVSKSVGSSIKIDSISIDLVNDDEANAGKCEHFSIRGFVSEVRKKNWKLCWPFALDGNHNKPEEETYALPPLHVEKFRWWRCQNCLQELGSEGNTFGYGNGCNYCSSARFKSTGTCPHMSSFGDAAMLQSDIGQARKLNIPAGRKVDATASIATDLNVNDCCLPSHDDKNRKKSEPRNTPAIVDESCPEDKMNHEVPVSAGSPTAVTSGLMTGRHHTVEIVSLKTNCNGFVEFCKPSCESHEAAEMELANEKLQYMFKNSIEICQTGKQPSAEEKNKKLAIACGPSRVAGMVDEVLAAAKDLAIEHPSPELDECDNAPSDSDETLSVHDLQDHHHDNSSGSHRRKTRKVRLLTELLAENGDVKANLTRTESSPSNSVPGSSAGIDILSDPQGLVAAQGNSIWPLDQNKKRKFPHDEEPGPLEISSPNNFHKKNSTCTESAETTGALASLDTKEDAGIDLQIGVNSHLNKFRFDRSPIGKKKNKSLVVDEFLSLAPSIGNMPEDKQDRTADANDDSPSDSVLLKSTQTAFTSRGMYPFALPPQKSERNSSVCKKKSKPPQFDEWQAPVIPWSSGMLREGPARRKDVEIKQMHSTISPFQSSQDAATGKGLQLSLNSCFTTQGYDSKYFSPIEHRQFPWRGSGSKENGVMGKDIQTNCVGDSDYRSKSESVSFLRKGVHCDLSRENYRMSFLNEKQKSTPQVDAGGRSLMQPKDFCSRGNNGKSTEMHEHSALTTKPSDQQADKVSEQGVPDDIPMEIVELMAKNQYERCLPDVEHEKPIETTINHSNAPMYGQGKLSFLSDETPQKPKLRAKNGRNVKIARSENGGTSKRKSVDCLPHIGRKHFNLSPLEQTHCPSEFIPFTHSQGKPPNGIKFSDTSSRKHCSSQNCQWIGNILGHRTSQTNLQTLGGCNSCQSVPQQGKETAHLWSSMIPSGMPFIYDIHQKHVSQSTNADMLSHCPNLHKGNVDGNHDLNFWNVDVTNIEKHNRTFDSESLSRPHAEYPFACKHSRSRPLDVYCNETIPAMHLLSLMDAGLPSGTPIGIDGNRKFLKRSSLPHDHHSKDFSGLSSGGYKTTSTMKPTPYDYYGKNHLSQSSPECFPAIQTVGASGFSFQHDKVVKKIAGSTGQASLKYQERDKASSDSPSQDNRSHQPVFITGVSGTGLGNIPVHNRQNIFVGTSDSVVFPLTFHEMENATKHKLESCNTPSTVLPPQSSSKTEICSVNRNPADFSMPEDENIYMIRGEDLKYRKSVFSESRPGLIKLDGRKRQKKLTAMKGKV